MAHRFHPDIKDGAITLDGREHKVENHVYEVTDSHSDQIVATNPRLSDHVDVGHPGSDTHKALLAARYEQGKDTSKEAHDAAVSQAEAQGNPPPLDFSAEDIEEFRAFQAFKLRAAQEKATPSSPVVEPSREEKNQTAVDEKPSNRRK